MSSATRMAIVAALAAVAAIATFGPGPLQAQTYSNNPYRPVPWPKPWQPDGLNGSIDFGATTGIYADPSTDHIWLATRCGRTPRYHTNQEGCVFKPDYDMVFKFDLDGNLVARFGAGTLGKPHSMFVDADGNVWVADFAGGAEYGHSAAEVAEEMRRRGLGAPGRQVQPRWRGPDAPRHAGSSRGRRNPLPQSLGGRRRSRRIHLRRRRSRRQREQPSRQVRARRRVHQADRLLGLPVGPDGKHGLGRGQGRACPGLRRRGAAVRRGQVERPDPDLRPGPEPARRVDAVRRAGRPGDRPGIRSSRHRGRRVAQLAAARRLARQRGLGARDSTSVLPGPVG